MPATIDTSNLNGFCREIARAGVGLTTWNVMLFEVRKILENCIRLTTRTNVERIKRSIENKNRTLNEGKGKSPILYVTKAGLVWFADQPGAEYEGVAQGRRTGTGKTFHPMTEFFRYGQPRWLRYQQMLADLRNKQIDARAVIGRAGQAWLQMAHAAGIELQGVPAYIRNAPAFRGRSKVHGTARKFRTASAMFIELVNQHQIFFGTMDGNRILQTSINGRYKYFQESMRRGVFADVKQIALRYKGLIAA